MIDLELIKWRLAETIQWCAPRVNLDDPEHSLRSPELDPHLDLDALDAYWGNEFYVETGMQEVDSSFRKRLWVGENEARISSFQTAMAKVVTKRAQLLRKNHLYPVAPLEKLKTGRLLLYFPDRNTVSGEVTNETDRFFDDYHIPPWDTWVSFWVAEEPNRNDSTFILSWIPPQFEDLVSAGIGVCMLGDVAWADDLDPNYDIRDLKENKLWPDLEALLAQLKPA